MPSAAREHAAMGMMRDSLPRLQRILQREKDEPLAGGGAKLEPEEALLELARQIEPDGGLPGKTDFQRLVHTLLALLTFLHEGHTATVGAFRLHVHRLIRFLETQKLPKLDEEERRTARNVLRWARAGGKVPWNLQELLQLQHKEQEAWGQIRKIAALPESASSE